ncbi:MAG TPA: helix-turn-helix domain-containing protein [Dehalococcoidales bacterium]|nr:helix-turn-helix domain-containing protein [Dehalococcoidales bacterium]
MTGEGVTIKVNTGDLVSVQDAAKELARPRVTIYRWVEAGKIIGIKLGGILFIPKSEVERIKNKKATGVEPVA